MFVTLTVRAHTNMVYRNTLTCRDNMMADLNAAYIMHAGQCGIVNKVRMLHVHNHGKLSFLAHMSHLIQTVTSQCDNLHHGL